MFQNPTTGSRRITRALAIAWIACAAVHANDETKVDTVEGNPPTGNEPWEICYGEYAITSIDTNVDYDTFRFFGRAGDPVRILVNSPNGLDPVMEVLDPTGAAYASASCGNACSFQLDMDPLPMNGMYTILLHDSGLNEGGTYTISLERILPERWVPWIPYNSTQALSINYNTDHDWLTFVADAGSHISLAVNSPNGLDPIVDVYDPAGALIATESCGNACSLVVDLPSLHATGTYTMSLRDSGLNEGGTVQVTLNCIFHPNGICPDPTVDQDLGTNYCTVNPNSTGLTGVASAYGSPFLADNRFFVRASDIPIAEFGLFFFGMTQTSKALPAPSDGILCIGDFVRNPVVMSCNNGGMEYRLDLDDLPSDKIFLPGDSWHFQAWHRDGSGSNTTDAVTVTFQ